MRSRRSSNGNLNQFSVVDEHGPNRPEMYITDGMTDELRYLFSELKKEHDEQVQ